MQWFSTGGSRPKKESRTPSGCVSWSKKTKEKVFNAHLGHVGHVFYFEKKKLILKGMHQTRAAALV